MRTFALGQPVNYQPAYARPKLGILEDLLKTGFEVFRSVEEERAAREVRRAAEDAAKMQAEAIAFQQELLRQQADQWIPGIPNALTIGLGLAGAGVGLYFVLKK